MRSLLGYGSKAWNMGWKDKAEWMQAWRQILENDGYDGIVWKDSTIDFGPSRKHDVYCLFNKGSIKLKKVASYKAVVSSKLTNSMSSPFLVGTVL